MATSGTYALEFDIAEIVEEAFDRCGLEARTGYDLVSARRSLDLLLKEWVNDQVNLWTLVENALTLTANINTYTLSLPALDILEAVVRDSNNFDQPMERMAIEEYLNQPDKASTGRPTHYTVLRNVGQITIKVWPTPDIDYTMVYYEIQDIQDTGAFTNSPNVPKRFLPALHAGLAYKIAQKNPPKMQLDEKGQRMQVGGVALEVRAELKQDYTLQYTMAKNEDRDRAPLRIIPRVG